MIAAEEGRYLFVVPPSPGGFAHFEAFSRPSYSIRAAWERFFARNELMTF
jgi:hypothetical protein